jgi:hypothetical protein
LPPDDAQLRRDDVTLLNRREGLHGAESALEQMGTAAPRASPVPATGARGRAPLRRPEAVLTVSDLTLAGHDVPTLGDRVAIAPNAPAKRGASGAVSGLSAS